MLQKMVINKIISLLAKQFNLYKIMKYVEEPNDADNRISELEIRLFQLGRKYGHAYEYHGGKKKDFKITKEK